MNDSQFTPALFLLGFALGGLLAYLELLWLKRPLHLADHWPGLGLVALVNAGFIYLLIVAINSYYSLFIVPIPIIPMVFILIKVLLYYVLRRITRSPLHSPLALLMLSLFFHGAVAIASYAAFSPINPMRSNLEAAIREKKNRWLEIMLWMSVKMEPNMTILVNEAILARNDDAARRLINHGADPRQVYWMPQADYDTLWRITQWRLDRGVKPEAITEISQHVGIGYVAVGYGVRELAYCLQKGLEPWLTDRTHTLYPSGYFCVLKSQSLLPFLRLFGGGDSGFRIGLTAQIDTRNQCVAATQGIVHPLPANLHVARTPKPMWVNKTAFALLYHRGAHGHQV